MIIIVIHIELLSLTFIMAATISSINPFPNDVRNAFRAYVQGAQYINRERIEYRKWN